MSLPTETQFAIFSGNDRGIQGKHGEKNHFFFHLPSVTTYRADLSENRLSPALHYTTPEPRGSSTCSSNPNGTLPPPQTFQKQLGKKECGGKGGEKHLYRLKRPQEDIHGKFGSSRT
ncbi:hypothetical protein TNIN_33091 [Trichonephila inaurata madagascariensis]|uniref:Uncharacterized protein n=1 Tax=Trichonephila inaurata madagascariensis TaxID=2747483 RepID=A0A8X6X7Q7_9ARAC|nr:hypothetical protein TNIN_33091 [Trichonephila inaurata madagascariensis]